MLNLIKTIVGIIKDAVLVALGYSAAKKDIKIEVQKEVIENAEKDAKQNDVISNLSDADLDDALTGMPDSNNKRST